jgi:hypothetical protein
MVFRCLLGRFQMRKSAKWPMHPIRPQQSVAWLRLKASVVRVAYVGNGSTRFGSTARLQIQLFAEQVSECSEGNLDLL